MCFAFINGRDLMDFMYFPPGRRFSLVLQFVVSKRRKGEELDYLD
jgi:hypothetical protein